MELFKKILSSVITLFFMVITVVLVNTFVRDSNRAYHTSEQWRLTRAQAEQIEELIKPIKRINKIQEVKDENAQNDCDKKHGKGKVFCWTT